ncbi:Peptide methionine sulfoxide reductase MsrB [Jannaschia aquimarina]|uniref:peptide-methionine (R)-S-oxide reductase n=1 Tax=Jannaschia aquimarina TaxID=935700 RepID=A0A0D1EE36_9RHOB|nr:Peptide methionine sulfoxide reductase MsrB [Jannaschia aquimarina]
MKLAPRSSSSRRALLLGGVAAAALAIGGGAWWRSSRTRPNRAFPFSLTEEEWRARLTDEEYAILRDSGTERAFSSPLDGETREGTYTCAGCGNPVYSSEHKYDSGTGWPSFTQAVSDDAVGERPDPKLLGLAIEIYCANCGGHLGHVFEDGPPPTGRRHCINGIALDFIPAPA